MEFTLSSPCSSSDPPLSRQSLALAYLDCLPPYYLVLWTDGSVPFPFSKGDFGVLTNCSLCGIEVTVSFSAGPVCLSFSAEACAILHALCWSWQHPQVFHFSFLFLLSDSHCPRHPVFSSVFPFTSITLADLTGIVFSSPLVLLGYNGSPDTRFSRGTTRLISWPDGERCSRPLQSHVVSLLLSLVSTLIFSRTAGVLSHLNFLPHRFSGFPPKHLCSLVTLAVFSLVFAATDTAYC